MKKKWTMVQEQHFQALAKERAEAMEEREAPLRALVEQLSGVAPTNLFHYLKNRADDIRDVLEPFDSGVRYVAEGGKE